MSRTIRTVIVDDEPLARRGIRLRLEEEPDFAVVAEYGSGASACAGIRELAPDVVFLDIHMPEMDGFEVIGDIGDPVPAVVFLTAYESHALRAFSVRALDYVLKPASDERLDRTLERVRSHVALTREATLGRRVRDIVHGTPVETPDDRTGAPPVLDALRVRERDRIVLVRPEQVDWIEASGNYVRLHAGSRSHLARYSLSELEERLAGRFVRIHRGTLVNRSRVVELQPHFHGDYVAVLADRTVLRVGRTYRAALLRDG